MWVGLWLTAIALGFLLAGIQLLPTIDALQSSVRQSTDANFAAQGSLHPANLIQLVAPYLTKTRVIGQNTHELGLYLGIAPLLLASYALLRNGPAKKHRRLVVALVTFAALGLLYAFGQYGPFGWLQTHLPVLNKFRFPCRAIVLFQLAMAGLAAIGFQRLWQHGQTNQKSRMSPFLLAGLIVVTAIDLGAYGFSYSIIGRNEPLASYIENTPAPPGPPTSRVLLEHRDAGETNSSPLRYGNRILLRGWQRADGYAGLEPRQWLDWNNPRDLQAAGVGWQRTSDGHFAKVANPNPRAVISHGTATVQVDQPGRIVLHTACDQPAECVVNESFHPGWQANNAAGQTISVEPDEFGFLRLLAPPGSADISLEFRPKSLQYGRLATGFGLSLLMMVVLRAAWVARRRNDIPGLPARAIG